MERGKVAYYAQSLNLYNKFIRGESIGDNMPFIPLGKLKALLADVFEVFKSESSLPRIKSPAVVIGDLHGHIQDLFRIMRDFPLESDRKYVFLGDLVDRGEHSLHTTIMVFLLKVLYPAQVFLIRGNHEFDDMCSNAGFKAEVLRDYSDSGIYESFLAAFSVLPLALIIDQRILCVHGGIGPSIETIEQIESIPRPIMSFEDMKVSSLVWSDPTEDSGVFMPSCRGTGFLFGKEALFGFLDKNNIEILIRGHECVSGGVYSQFDGRVYTVFSASNYCGVSNNFAGALEINSIRSLISHRYAPSYMIPKIHSHPEKGFVPLEYSYTQPSILGDKKKTVTSLISRAAPMVRIKTRLSNEASSMPISSILLPKI